MEDEDYLKSLDDAQISSLQKKVSEISKEIEKNPAISEELIEKKLLALKSELKESIDWLLQKVRDGNGKPSIISSIQQIESKYENLEKELHDKMKSMDENINLKFEGIDLKLGKMETSTKSCVKEVVSELKEYWKKEYKEREEKEFDKEKIDRSGWWGIKGRIIAAGLGALLMFIPWFVNEAFQSKEEAVSLEEMQEKPITIEDIQLLLEAYQSNSKVTEEEAKKEKPQE